MVYRDKVKVLAPRWLRDEIRGLLEKMAENYSDRNMITD
jgi:hypothetical protein